jgi:ABC-type Fe3+-citrate transport system substrate-binding protein
MPLKKAATTSSILTPIDPNQGNEALIREARNQKMAISSPSREEELNEKINNLKVIHQQVEKHREKMLRLSELQRKIDEATEEMCNIEAHENLNNLRDRDYYGRNHDNLRHEVYNA